MTLGPVVDKSAANQDTFRLRPDPAADQSEICGGRTVSPAAMALPSCVDCSDCDDQNSSKYVAEVADERTATAAAQNSGAGSG